VANVTYVSKVAKFLVKGLPALQQLVELALPKKLNNGVKNILLMSHC